MMNPLNSIFLYINKRKSPQIFLYSITHSMPIWNEYFTLNTGAKIPAVGLGTWQSGPDEVRIAVRTALEAGYRHMYPLPSHPSPTLRLTSASDAAALYDNEEEIGQGIKDSGVPRSEIFLTSKLWNTAHAAADVEPALDETLRKLGTDYLDLYLLHTPVSFAAGRGPWPHTAAGAVALGAVPVAETWAALEALAAAGKVRAIGVSNFNERRLTALLATAAVVPAVNQIEAHPWLQQAPLAALLRAHAIHVTAFSPLGNNIAGLPRVQDDPAVAEAAALAGATVPQTLIAWAVARGTSVIPKSVTPARIVANFQSEGPRMLGA